MNYHITVFAIGLLLNVAVLSRYPPLDQTFEEETTAQFTAQIEPQSFVVKLPFVSRQEQFNNSAELVLYQPKDPAGVGAVTPVAATTVFSTPATPTPEADSPGNYATTTEGALATYGQPSALPMSGYAMFYNPNVMQEVMQNRLAMGQVSSCTECMGSVALLRAGDLNRRVWLEWPDGVVEGPFLVADVAARQHVERLLARNWVVDVDYYTAVRRKMAGPVFVTVWDAPPPASGTQGARNDIAAQQTQTAPFEPLYSTPVTLLATVLPTASLTPASPTPASPTPSVTLAPVVSATPYPPQIAVPQGFPPDTPVPTATALPALNQSSETPVPSSTPTVAVAVPTSVRNATIPSATASNTAPAIVSPTAVHKVTQNGFPPDTPVPTATALPAIYPTTTATPTIATK